MLKDAMLLWKFNRGSADVLLQIYEKYKDQLVTLATALLHDANAGEDAVHDVFVSLIRSAPKLKLSRSLKAYLTVSVVNNVRSRIKAKRREQTVGLDNTDTIISDTDRPDGFAIFGEQMKRLTFSLAQLPYEQREVIMLRHYSGMKFKAIAESQGVSTNTVQGRYRYGLEKLRSLLNGQVKK